MLYKRRVREDAATHAQAANLQRQSQLQGGLPSLLDHLPFGQREREERLEEQQVIVLLGKYPVATLITEKSCWELLHGNQVHPVWGCTSNRPTPKRSPGHPNPLWKAADFPNLKTEDKSKLSLASPQRLVYCLSYILLSEL